MHRKNVGKTLFGSIFSGHPYHLNGTKTCLDVALPKQLLADISRDVDQST